MQILSDFGLNGPSFKCFAEIRSSANILVSRGACCPPVRPGALTVSPDMRAPGRCRSPLPVQDRACSGCTWPRNSSAPRTSLLGRVQAIAMIWTRQLRTSRRPMRSFRTENRSLGQAQSIPAFPKQEGVLTNWLACALPLLPCTRLPKVSFQSPAYTHVRDSEPRRRSWLSCLPSHMRMEDFPDTCKGLSLSWMLLPCPDRAVFVPGYH